MRPASFSDPSDDRIRAYRGRAARAQARAYRQARRKQRAALEGLEPRVLLATLPAPIVVNRVDVTNPNQDATTGGGDTGRLWESSPSLAVNPLNRDQMAMVYTEVDPSEPSSRTPVQARLRVSNNGGATWSNPISIGGVRRDPTTPDTAPENFEQVTDGQVAFDRNGRFYVLTSQHTPSNNEGVLMLYRFSMAANGSVTKDQTFGDREIYAWTDRNNALLNQAIRPVLAIDTTLASYTDPDDNDGNPTHVNPSSGSLYIAWGTADETPPNTSNWNPNRVLMIASADGGLTFTSPVVINDNGNSSTAGVAGQDGVRAANPQIAISQGTADGSIPGGLVTVIYEDIAGLNDGRGRIMADQVRFNVATGVLTTSTDVEVARTTVKSNIDRGGQVASNATPIGIGAGATIASDNSLGLHSLYQGRLYVAFVDRDPTSGNPTDNTDIWVKASDDGGRTWSVLTNPYPNRPNNANTASGDDRFSIRVNDDDGAVDGYSGMRINPTTGEALAGRPQFAPSIAVDDATGSVVLSWYDARHDAAGARVALYMAASIDGGQTYSDQRLTNREYADQGQIRAFANEPLIATDLASGLPVVLGPIPDNQSPTSNREGLFGFGERQALYVYDGVVIPAWSSNRNGDPDPRVNPTELTGNARLDIRLAHARLAGGPRVVNGSMGPVSTTTADGRPEARELLVTFDRPVDPGTFSTADVTLLARDSSGTPLPAQPIVTAVNPVAGSNNTRFRVLFTGVTTPGTISYAIGPEISDRIRRAGADGSVTIALGNRMDQDGDGNEGEPLADLFDAPTRRQPNQQALFAAPYVGNTLPLIVPGPRVISSGVPGLDDSGDDLALRRSVSALDVTFDWPMRADTFTIEDVLRIHGPRGSIYDSTGAAGPIGEPIDVRPTFPLRANQPIGNGATIASYLSIPAADVGTFLIADLDVRLDISHTQPETLQVTLIYDPLGQNLRIPLVRNLASGDLGLDFRDTLLDDAALLAIDAVRAPFTGSYRPAYPDGSLTLASLIGRSIAGLWQLEIADTSAADGAAGTLNGWALEAAPADPTTASARSFRVAFERQSLSGTYTLELGADIRSIAAPGAPEGYRVDANQNAGVDAVRQVGRVPGSTTETRSFLPQPDQTQVVLSPNRTAISTISVPEDFVVQDAELELNIQIPNTADLEAYLITPAGERIRLFSRVGNGPNFTGTILDDGDEASPPPAINDPLSAAAPFTGRFRPESPLDVLNGRSSVDGTGLYTLEITNRSVSQAGMLLNWALRLDKLLVDGLGETVADRSRLDFRIFTMEATDEQASSVWTPLGPTGLDGAPQGIAGSDRSGQVGAVAIDPSDPTGNTVYIGGATGGVWKTNNFLTTDPEGPTWVPLTDFGPHSGMNVSTITIIPIDNDPSRSIILAGTGHPSAGGPAGTGVGILLSRDGGRTWEVLDSSNNTSPFNTAGRDRALASTRVYGFAFDPQPLPGGGRVVFAALENGLWRSFDTGRTWTRVLSGAATSVVFDPTSGTFDAQNNPNGNLQVVYAGIQGQGVLRSPNQGDLNSWSLINGGLGHQLIRIRTSNTGGNAAPVGNTGTNPNGAAGRIALAKPNLVPSTEANARLKNLLYKGWLYAAVAEGGTIELYLTKDQGLNWTRVELPDVGGATPSNNTSLGDVPLSAEIVGLWVSPLDPRIVYIHTAGSPGSSTNPSLIRVDTTALHDPYAFYVSNDLPDGQTILNAGGPVTVNTNRIDDQTSPPYYEFDPRRDPYLNLQRNPDGITSRGNGLGDLPNAPPGGPFTSGNASYYVDNISGFSNSGAGATWTRFDNLGAMELGGTASRMHALALMVDPTTGGVRMAFGYDRGIATGVDVGGSLSGSVGSAPVVFGPRDGNLQIAQFYYGAAQPSSTTRAGGAPGGLLYGSSGTLGGPQSQSNILDTGILEWTGLEGATGPVATDPTGTGTQYQYWYPNGTADFFQNALTGQSGLNVFSNYPYEGSPAPVYTGGATSITTGLFDPEAPGGVANQWRNASTGINFAVNPRSNRQLVIADFTGQVFRTQDGGETWTEIGPTGGGTEPQPLDGSAVLTLAYGAPDPAVTGNRTDNFIYAGTNNGNIWVTTNGGAAWTNIGGTARGLDGTPVREIVPNPNGTSHEAYALTRNGVFHIADALAPGARWTNITGQLFNIPHDVFGAADATEALLRELWTLAVDWRYTLPAVDPGDSAAVRELHRTAPLDRIDATGALTNPAVYVGGRGGVFRTLDDGRSWALFGEGMPVTEVRDLDMALGKVDPATGRPVASPGDPNLLAAFTYGRGAFGIRLAPVVLPGLLALDPSNPTIPGGSDTGNDDGTAIPPGAVTFRDLITADPNPFIAGYSQQSDFGNAVRITLYDLSGDNPRYVGGFNPDDPITTADWGLTDKAGRFVHVETVDGQRVLRPGVQIVAGMTDYQGVPLDLARLADGEVKLGVQATDLSGTRGPVEEFVFTLDTTPPAAPVAPDLQGGSDSPGTGSPAFVLGETDIDNLTFDTTPSFDVAGVEPMATLQLLRDGVVVTTLYNVAGGTVAISDSDPGLVLDGSYVYTARQYDAAGNLGAESAPLTITLDTTKPVAPPAPDLQPLSDTPLPGEPGYEANKTEIDNLTSDTTPTFDVLNVELRGTVELLRDGVVVATLVDVTPGPGGLVAITDPGGMADGTYAYTVRQYDRAGNLGDTSEPLSVTIDTTKPSKPSAPDLQALSDTPLPGQPGYVAGVTDTDNLTTVTTPTFDISGVEARATLELLRDGVVVATLRDVAGGTVAITDLVGVPGPGDYVYTVRQYDFAGNLSETSDGLTITVDDAPPVTPGAPDLDPLSDTPLPGAPGFEAGETDIDNLTYDTSPTFLVAGVEALATVELLRNGVVVAQLANAPAGTVSITDPGPVPEGTHVYTARQVDRAGNPSGISGALEITIDTTNPVAPPAPDLQPLSDTPAPGLRGFEPGVTDTDNLTSDTTPTFDVLNVEPRGTVELLRNGVVVATLVDVTPGPGGLVAITDPGGMADGTYAYTVRQYDRAGNLGETSAALSVTIDTTKPVTPPAPDLQALSDTPLPGEPGYEAGTTDTDNLTTDTTPTFNISSIEAGATVELLRDGVVVAWLINVPTAGTVALTDPGVSDSGTYAYTTRQYDRAGNLSDTSAPLSVTIDTGAPATPSTPDLQAGSDTPLSGQPGFVAGTTDTDNLTTDTTPTFDISGIEAGATVELLRDGVVVAKVINAAAGTVALTDPGVPASGDYLYTARQYDRAGNLSGTSAALTITVDTVAPAAVGAPDLQPLSDSPLPGEPTYLGGTTDTDDRTNALTPTLDVSGVEAGATLQLLRNGAVVATLPLVAGGTVAITDPGPLPEGTHVYTARQYDRAGNLGPVSTSSLTVTIDRTPPVASSTPDLQALSDTPLPGEPTYVPGVTDTDDETADTSPTFDVLSAEADATILLLRKPAGAADDQYIEVGRRVGPGAVTDISSPADGAYDYASRQIDVAGNPAPLSGTLRVTIDTTPPVAPPAPDLTPGSDTGASDSDDITRVTIFATPVFALAGIEPTATAYLLRKPAGASVGAYQIVASRVGPGTLADPVAIVQDGQYDYAVRQRDRAGNLGPISAALVVTIDTTQPPAPQTPDLRPESDTGPSDTDNITSDTSPRFDISGVEAGTRVNLMRNGLIVATLAPEANPGGTVTLVDPGPVPPGNHVYTAFLVDLAGNQGPIGGGLAVTIITSDLPAPGAPDLQAASDSGVSNSDDITNVTTPTFDIASALLNATVELLRDGNIVATRTGPGTLTDPGPVADGTYLYTARQRDMAGNLSGPSAPLSVTIDTTIATPSAPSLAPGSDTGTPGDNLTSVTSPTLDLPAEIEPGAFVELLRRPADSMAPFQVVATGNGPGSLTDLGPLAEGTYEYFVRQRDIAGNQSLDGALLRLAIRTTEPTTPPAPDLIAASDTGVSNSDNITAAATLTFQVTTPPPGWTLELLRGGAVVANATRPGPDLIADPGPLADGVYAYSVRYVDEAGTPGAPSTVLNVTVDRTAPAAPATPDLQPASDTGPSNSDNITSDTSPTFDVAGVEPGATLELLRDGVVVQTLTGVAGGTVAITDPNAPSRPGQPYSYTARQTDRAGNLGAPSGALAVVIDTSSPPAPPSSPVLAPESDTGASDSDRITAATLLHFHVETAEPGATVELLRRPLGSNGSFTVVAGRVGPGTLTDATAANDGRYEYAARQLGPAGAASPSSPTTTVTVDRTAPVVSMLTLLSADDTGVRGDGRTSRRAPRLLGSTESGATVGLFAHGLGLLAGTTATAGVFTIAPPDGLLNGPYVFYAQAIDLAGNLSAPGPDLALTFESVANDYDGDGKADLSVYRPTTGEFFIVRSTDGPLAFQFGPAGAVPVPGDYDGDGKTDLAVFNPATALWYVRPSSNPGAAYVQQFGPPGALPVPADYDGDGRADLAVFDSVNALWYVRPSSNPALGFARQFGPGGSTPVPADYDGDGRADLAVFDPTSAVWYIDPSGPQGAYARQFGPAGSTPAPADFDGDRIADLVVYQPTIPGQFYVLPSANGAAYPVTIGPIPGETTTGPDVPLMADFDGDGKAEVASFAPTLARWAWRESSSGAVRVVSFGAGNLDRALPGPLYHRQPAPTVAPAMVRTLAVPAAPLANTAAPSGRLDLAAQARMLSSGGPIGHRPAANLAMVAPTTVRDPATVLADWLARARRRAAGRA